MVQAAGAVAEEADVAEANKYSKQPVEGATLKITWVKSAIGHAQDQRAALRSMGLTRLNQTVELPDTATMRGQMFKVKHLLRVEEA